MSEFKDGGPAFPDPGRAQSAKQREVLTDTGMTLRDYFAAKAMAAIIGAVLEKDGSTTASALGSATDGAYFIADEMLRARGQS